MIEDSFGVVGANTIDVSIGLENFSQIVIDTPTTSSPLVFSGDVKQTIDGFYIGIQNETETNDDSTIYTYGNLERCGVNLADTTAYPGDSFSMRLENTNGASGNALIWVPKPRPIGNQILSDLQVIGWVRIDKEAYWAGTHQMPRLYVDYDNGTEVYGEAAQLAADTPGITNSGWQKISVPFTPTTSFGSVGMEVKVLTDAAVAADRYVYWGHYSVLDGAGKTVNTGLLDIWSNGTPTTPFFATVPPPADVAEAVLSNDGLSFADDSIAGQIRRIDINVTDNQALILPRM
jgi:hypothetical protein